MRTLLTIFESHPYAGTRLKEGLDAVLAVSATPMAQIVLFRGPAVLALSKHHEADSDHRDYVQTFKALPLYDVEQIFICEASLKTHHLTLSDINLDEIGLAQIKELSDRADIIQVY